MTYPHNTLSDLFELHTSPALPEGTVKETAPGTYVWEKGGLTITSATEEEDGILHRVDTIENNCGLPITLRTVRSRFFLPEGEYEVYTQDTQWQHESRGCWRELNGGVYERADSARTCYGAIPFFALWNRQTDRGYAFHLFPCGTWEFSVRRVPAGGENCRIEVCLGLNSSDLALPLSDGDLLRLPEILCYDIHNKRDMDCARLHRYCHRHYPRREMPVFYNTWLYCFDQLSVDVVETQAKLAADLGVEYFVIDAGWFGTGTGWWSTVGDWEESRDAGFKGEMKRVADTIRSLGMKFGLWFEIERAMPDSEAYKTHPDYYIHQNGCYFVDYRNPDARTFILKKLDNLIERYGIRYVKFDFNADFFGDTDHDSMTRYFDGYQIFIDTLKQRHPDLYLHNCAGGGHRLCLGNGRDFDSFWPSDNQSMYEVTRIYKDTLIRMPSQWMEKWTCLVSLPKFKPVCCAPLDQTVEKMVTPDDGLWSNISGVNMSWVKGFLTGSPIGFSMDLRTLTETQYREIKEFVAAFKADRGFWMNADATLLADTPRFTGFAYADEARSDIRLVLFGWESFQDTFTLYPPVNPQARYRLSDGTERTGEDLLENGVTLAIGGQRNAFFCNLKQI